MNKPKNVRDYLGLALIPQAGVAIGLAALGARTLGGETGSALQTIILASSVLYELIGPGCAKLSLYLSGSYQTRIEDIVPEADLPPGEGQKSPIDLLVERIQKIQKDLPPPKTLLSEEEEAFLEASEKQYAAMEAGRRYANIHHSRTRRF